MEQSFSGVGIGLPPWGITPDEGFRVTHLALDSDLELSLPALAGSRWRVDRLPDGQRPSSDNSSEEKKRLPQWRCQGMEPEERRRRGCVIPERDDRSIRVWGGGWSGPLFYTQIVTARYDWRARAHSHGIEHVGISVLCL